MHFITKKLGEVCEILIGGTPRRGISKYWKNGTLPWVSIADLSRSKENISDTKERITELGVKESNVKLIPKGTLIFSFKLSIGKMAFADVDLYTNEAIAGLVIKDVKELDKKFLYYFLRQTVFDTVQKAVKGNTLNKEKIKALEIPLPPIEEQKKIVARLEKLLAKVKETRRMRVESDTATQSILSAELHKIFEEGKRSGWESRYIGDKKIMMMTSGGTPSRSNPSYYNGKIPWLKSGELNDNTTIEDSKEHITEEAIKQSSAKVFPKNTVLLAMYGATAGKLGILNNAASTNQAVAGMLCNAKQLHYKYLFYVLVDIRNKIVSQAWGGAQPNLSQTIIQTFQIPLPPLDEQKKIVARLDALSEKLRILKEHQQSVKQDIDRLEQSILHQAFASNEG